MKTKIIYKKKENTGFISIMADYVDEDVNYLYLKCGRYIKANIIARRDMPTATETSELTDDA